MSPRFLKESEGTDSYVEKVKEEINVAVRIKEQQELRDSILESENKQKMQNFMADFMQEMNDGSVQGSIDFDEQTKKRKKLELVEKVYLSTGNKEEDSSDAQKSKGPFDHLHHPWLFKRIDLLNDKAEKKGEDGLKGYQTYDSISCVTLELLYKIYSLSKKEDHRVWPFKAESSIDFKLMIENRFEKVDGSIKKMVYRVKRVKKP